MNNNESAKLLLRGVEWVQRDGTLPTGEGRCFGRTLVSSLVPSSLQPPLKLNMAGIKEPLGPASMYLLSSFEWCPLFSGHDQQSAAVVGKLWGSSPLYPGLTVLGVFL